MRSPTPEEIELLEEEFHFHPLAMEDATTRHQRPKVDQYTDFYLVIFYSVEIEASKADQPATPGWRRLTERRTFCAGYYVTGAGR